MTEPILEISKLNKSFGPVHVLNDVDLNVYPGQVTALVGDNGAGKSTLIKCIAGIHAMDSGETRFEGKPVAFTDPRVATGLGISPKQAIAMGDGANDLPMMGEAGLSVAYHAKPKVRAAAAVAIDSGGLDRLLEIVRPDQPC